MDLTQRNPSEKGRKKKLGKRRRKMKHSKRYAVIFNKWSIYKNIESITEFDTMEEVDDEVELIEELYKDTPRPEHRRHLNSSKSTQVTDYHWCAPSFCEAFWGYMVVDFQNEKIIKWGHDELRTYKKNSDIRKLQDWLFRGEDEIPKDYKWDVGEYDGWLQFRWGNGLNDIKYGENAMIDGMTNTKSCIRHCKYRKKKYSQKTYNEVEEAELDKLNEEILAEANS
jgi:hypothetical protein